MGNGLFSDRRTVRRAWRTVLVLCLLAMLFAALLVSVLNDLYAFIKPDRVLLLRIDSPLSLSEFSALLEREGVVANPAVFSLYVRLKGKAETAERFVGSLPLNTDMSYREILRALTQASAPQAE